MRTNLKNLPKFFFYLGFFAIANNLLFAQNLVVNPSFERAFHCVTGDEARTYANIPSLQLSQCEGWTSFSEQGTSDLHQPCNTWSYKPDKNAKARTGRNFAGFYAISKSSSEENYEYREYIIGQLTKALTAGEKYTLSFYLLLSDKSQLATSSIGVYFSSDTLYSTANFDKNAPFIPQLQHQKNNFLSNKTQWVELKFDYRAEGGEKYLMIGNFNDDKNTDTLSLGFEKHNKNAYYYIDDVFLCEKNCKYDAQILEFGFRGMIYDKKDNKPIENASLQAIPVLFDDKMTVKETDKNGKFYLKIYENHYLMAIKKACYLPYFDFFEVPNIKNNHKQAEQMHFFPLTALENGNKIIIAAHFLRLLPDLLAKKDEKALLFIEKLKMWAVFLKENPTLVLSLNAGLSLSYYTNETKKIEMRNLAEQNLAFMKQFLLENGAKTTQMQTKIFEVSKENPSVEGELTGLKFHKTSPRTEIEVISSTCTQAESPMMKNFFPKLAIGEIYILEKVYFDPDSPQLQSASFEELNQLAQFLKSNKNLTIKISGHTDIGIADSSDDFLQKLSENRAQAVADYLVKKGFSKKNISAEGFANRKPIADNSTTEGRAKNRRVEVEIVAQ